MKARMRLVLPGAALAAIVILSPLALAGSPDSTEPPIVTITAHDHTFDAPETMPSGAVTIRFVNEGESAHHAQLIRFRDGKTPEDMAAAMEQGEIPDFITLVGGPSIVMPGMEATVTVELRPGSYWWLCFVEDENGVPHLAQGMASHVEVEAGPRTELPEADNTMMLNDYEFKLGKPLTAGRHVVRVRNYAAQPHEVVLIKLAPGKTMDDVMAYMESGEEGPPPGMPIGGMQALSQGVAANLILDLEPGSYGLICYVPDAGDFQPHFAHGMVDEITVSE